VIAKWRRRLDLLVTGHLGPKCRHGCGQRVPLERVADHEGTNHAGDEL
jgi:hypothetical protein